MRRLLRRRAAPAAPAPVASAARPTKAVRDFQRSRVYRSEESCLPSIPQRGFDRVEHMQAYVDELLATRFCRGLLAGGPITVKDGRGSRRARTDGSTWIAVPRAMRREWVLLHEVAHCLTPDKHGPQFCACYLELVRRRLGPEAADALALAFAGHRVRVGSVPPGDGPA